MDYSRECDGCRKMYAKRIPRTEAPCITCRIDPFDENAAAIKIFLIVRYQLIMGTNGPIEINHIAIDAAINREGIQDAACFNKVVELSSWWIQRLGDAD